MPETITIVGFGPGISIAVAEKFGVVGFSVALVASMATRGIAAVAFPADAGDPAAIRAAIGQARAQLGPVAVLHWNAFGGASRRECRPHAAARTVGGIAAAERSVGREPPATGGGCCA